MEALLFILLRRFGCIVELIDAVEVLAKSENIVQLVESFPSCNHFSLFKFSPPTGQIGTELVWENTCQLTGNVKHIEVEAAIST